MSTCRSASTPETGAWSSTRGVRDYTIESVDNALLLLALLQERESVRLSDVALELKVARSTAHRLLGTLVRRGFAVQDELRRYRLGPALVRHLPAAGVSAGHLRTIAHPILRHLARTLDETSHLMVREGVQVRFVDSVVGRQELHIGSRVGVALPAHVTAGGKALLAELDRDEIVHLYENELPPPHISSLLRTLSAVRRRGYATNFGALERGVTAIGVRIRPPGQASALAALTVSGQSLRLPRARVQEVAATLMETARRLESDLERLPST